MSIRRLVVFLLLLGLTGLLSIPLQAQGPTTGRIEGVVSDQRGALIVGAEVRVASKLNSAIRTTITDPQGHFAVPLLPPGSYQVKVSAKGFAPSLYALQVSVTETVRLDVLLELSGTDPLVVTIRSLIQTNGAQLGRVIDSHQITELPLATRNYTQILSLSPGVAGYLPDGTGVGRNTQTISVNGARMTQNNIQLNGVDANTMGTRSAVNVAVPAPETIQEFKVLTSLYDASFGRSGGGNVQIVTKSGGDSFHGVVYEFFRNDALNANNPFLKAASVSRPVLKRNTFGGTFSGPIKNEKAFFFTSYQGTRESNGGSILNSVSSSVLVAPGLTNDRSEQNLLNTFKPTLNGQPVMSINSVALNLLNVKLENGQFLIPTPRANGRYSGSAISQFKENQFNANIDYRLSEKNWLAAKFFFANAPAFFALPSFRGTGPNVPGFGTNEENNVRIFSVQDVHNFSQRVFNELRLGYNLHQNLITPSERVKDTDLGINRSNANLYPGLGLIRINPAAGGVIVGTQNTIVNAVPWVGTLSDTFSVTHSSHLIRLGGEVRFNEVDFVQQQFNRGQIDFATFNNFLIGISSTSIFGSGIGDRKQRAIDYNAFFQDDWKVTSNLTLNLGLRYELDLPPYEKRGLIATFDPALYQAGTLSGPPRGGFVQAGNANPQYDLSPVPNVSKYVVHGTDRNNLAPRLGVAYSIFDSLVVRGGFGLFHSRPTFQYVSTSVSAPPFYVLGRQQNAPFANPYFPAPPQGSFPTFVPGVALAGTVLDRKIRTSYFEHYNVSIESKLTNNLLLEVAFVGTRGRNLFRQVAINQAILASAERPIFNEITGTAITINTIDNLRLRAPYQGVDVAGFFQNQTTASSSYNSLQASFIRQFARGFQLLASYTFAKSIDDSSGTGGGAGSVGIVNPGSVGDTGTILGNQLNQRANRGVSDFDRTHRLVIDALCDLPSLAFNYRSKGTKALLANWQRGMIMVTMSGLPVDIVDSNAGAFYLGQNNNLSRPNWAPGANRDSAIRNVTAGYFFNPTAFARPIVPAGSVIPSSNGSATAAASGTDIGNVGRNVLRGPSQTNLDLSIAKRFPIRESLNLELRAEFFNLFNHVNLANPISDLNVVPVQSFNPTTGQILSNPGDFGKIISTSNNPRLIQFALKFSF